MPRKPEPEDYRLVIERAWADIHHSRIQEWTALGVVTGSHIGILQLIKTLRESSSDLSFPLIGIIGACTAGLFAIFGALMTLRHRHLMRIKLRWIYSAEEKLGLILNQENEMGVIPANAKMETPLGWRGLAIPRVLSTSFLILCFYILLLILDIASLFFFVSFT